MKKEAAGFSIIKTLGTTTKIHDITHNGMHMADSLKWHGQSRYYNIRPIEINIYLQSTGWNAKCSDRNELTQPRVIISAWRHNSPVHFFIMKVLV